jgi:hypothetical protein
VIRAFAVVVVVAAVAAGCPDYAPPLDARIRCATADQCPDDWTCKLTIGRCIADDTDDREGPDVSNVSLAPDHQHAGADVTVHFVVSESLARLPVLTLDEAALDIEPQEDPDTFGFTFVYTVSAGDAPGLHAFATDLVDVDGNEATPALATFTVDPP